MNLGKYTPRTQPQSDMQARCAYIAKRADAIVKNPEGCEIKDVADLLGYLALILQKHMETNER